MAATPLISWPATMHPAAGRLLLLMLLAVVAVATADDDFGFSNYTCSAPGNYSDDSPYGKNVADLLSTLSPPSGVDNWWFRRRTVGQVSGLAMCYADSEPDRCLNCLASVIPKYYLLLPMCDHSRDAAFLSSDGCVIRYAGEPFFGSAAADGPGARMVLRSVIRAFDAAAMREARQALLSGLAETAGGDARRFAAGRLGYNDTVLGTWQVMYGMAQCTRDLPPGECSGCLVDHLAAMYTKASVINSTEASVMGLSCYLRYQLNEPIRIAGMAVPPAAAPTTAEEPSTWSAPPLLIGNGSTPLIVALAAVVTLFSSV